MSASPPSRVVAVLGMHRSGTSWLAGSLEQLGLDLGAVSTSDPHNRHGNREHPELMAVHDAVLRACGGSWKRPPRRVHWPDEQARALADFVARMDACAPLWGFKDPRALLLLAEWRRRVPRLELVGIYRHPLAVHRSLAARSARFRRGRSLRLWRAYNRRLVQEHRVAPFPLVRFDVPPAELEAQLRQLVEVLHLPRPADRAGFFDQGLVHQEDAAEDGLPWSCRRLWAYLEAHRLRP